MVSQTLAENLIRRLSQGKVRGSYGSAIETIICMRNLVSTCRRNTVEDILEHLKPDAERLIQAQPIEIAVQNVIRRIFHVIRENETGLEETQISLSLEHINEPPSRRISGTPKKEKRLSVGPEDSDGEYNVKASAIQAINELKDEVETARANIASQAHEHIHSNEIILTFGSSQTVENFLKDAAKYRKFQVIVLETAPSFQGHSTAKKLSEAGIETILIPDSAVFAVMSRVSKVIMSAHAVHANGGSVAISGSQNVCAAAKHYSIPVVVCAGLYKLSPLFPYDVDEFTNYVNPNPVLAFSDELIGKSNVLNPFFDYISPDFISLFITNIDSPAFRQQVAFAEKSVSELEASVKRVSLLIQRMTDLAEGSFELTVEYSAKRLVLTQEVLEIASVPGTEDNQETTQFSKIANTIKEIERSRRMMMVNIKDAFVEPLQQYVSTELTEIKQAGKEYNLAMDSFESCLFKYTSKKPQDQGFEEAGMHVARERRNYHEKALEYAKSLNEFTETRQHSLIEPAIAYLYTEFAFFHQGFENLQKIEPEMSILSQKLKVLKSQHTPASTNLVLDRLKLEETYNPFRIEPKITKDSESTKCGYLYMRVVGKVRVTWQRRYFGISNHKLYYYQDTMSPKKSFLDLRICMVRETSQDRRWCFEIVNPMETLVLQADSQASLKEWISSIQNGVQTALLSSSSNESLHKSSESIKEPPKPTKKVTLVAGNDKCADCSSTNQSEWVCCNFGIVLCITCSGIHRGLGRQISKIRSLSLDKWEPETLGMLCSLGNDVANEIYEGFYHRGSGLDKPLPESDMFVKYNTSLVKEQFIYAKYVQKQFVKDPSEPQDPDLLIKFNQACRAGNIPQILFCIANGVNLMHSDLNGRACTHLATMNNQLYVVEFLSFWNVDFNARDNSGKSPLHYAVLNKNLDMVLLLVKKRVDTMVHDMSNKMAVDYAVELAHREQSESLVNIITLLRLATLNDSETIDNWRNEQMKQAISEIAASSPSPTFIESTIGTIDRSEVAPVFPTEDFFNPTPAISIPSVEIPPLDPVAQFQSQESVLQRKPSNPLPFEDDPWAN